MKGKAYNMGTLYDINKQLILLEESISKEEKTKKINKVCDFVKNTYGTHFMLLCKERTDFTLFIIKKYDESNINENSFKSNLEECLHNRGEILQINKDHIGKAYEFYIKIDGQVFLYLFFPFEEAAIMID